MKKIVVCSDGTWNKPGIKDRGKPVKTNVQKIYEPINTGTAQTPQLKYYGQGVGTGFTLGDMILGGSTGLGIDANIMNAYKFLMWNYEPGDEIYLFGFSRGAYTVRSLAGFIRNCGIMQPSYLHLISEAYNLYRDRSSITHPDSDLMKSFKRAYGINQEETFIHFIGVWDTVGALGIPLKWFDIMNRRYQFHDVTISSQIKYAYHALAVDEKRKTFTPTLWQLSPKAVEDGSQISEQVWFPGVHSNVGGGYADSGLSDIALQWMIDKARNTGLEFDNDALQNIKPETGGELRNSASGIFSFMRKLVRSINSGVAYSIDEETGKRVQQNVVRNESIHYTCMQRRHQQNKYKPKNLSDALSRSTPFDPLKEKWKQDWNEYLT
jgi:uncharacterized protein (DUF2235 family)